MAAPLDPGADLYKILQVDPEADPDVIQAAFRRLAMKYHPDVAPGPEAAAKMSAISAAWSVLRDPVSRAAHDRMRAARLSRGHVPGVARPPGARAQAAGSPAHRAAGHVPGTEAGRGGGGGGGVDRRDQAAVGSAGPPPGNPSGSVLNFGRYAGWSLGEIARRDLEYIEWLDRMAIGRNYREELDQILRRTGRRQAQAVEAQERRGLFRRR